MVKMNLPDRDKIENRKILLKVQWKNHKYTSKTNKYKYKEVTKI